MNTKHWHLTNEPNKWDERGGPIKTRKEAELLAKSVRKFSSKPVYTETCTAACMANR